jgi:hypothetical protein
VRHDKAEPPAVAAGGSRSRAAKPQISPRITPPGVSECRGCGEVTELIQDSDWCWTCVYTDPPYIDYAGQPALASDDPWRTAP